MPPLPLLPAREPPLPGESLESLVRRNAVAMGYERVACLRSLLVDRGRPPPCLSQLGPGPLLSGLAELLGISVDRLLMTTVHSHAEQLVLTPRHADPAQFCDSKTVLRFFTSSPPVCPRCLSSEPPYERLLWNFRPLPVCRDHACLLLHQCPACQRTLRTTRLDVRRCRCGFDLTLSPSEKVGAGVLSLAGQCYAWLSDDKTLLPEMPTAAACAWAERLQAAVLKTPAWLEESRQRFSLPEVSGDACVAWLAAAEMLSDWPDSFEQFLNVYQKVTKHRTSDTGLSRSFGTLLRDADHFEQFGYATPADALRSYLLEHYTRGHLNSKVCLFQRADYRRLTEQRPWITQTETARQLGVRCQAIADLVSRGLLVGEVRRAGHRGRSIGLISRESVATLRQQLHSAFRVHEISEQLGIGRHRIFELIRGDLLAGAVRTRGGWLVPRSSVEELDQLIRSLPVLKNPNSDWMTARESTRRYGRSGLTLVRILELIKSGRLRARRSSRRGNCRGLLLCRSGLQKILPEVRLHRAGEQGFPLNQLSRQLIPGRPVKESVLRKWIRSGLLHAERKGRAWSVAASEVQRFRDTYCLADEACRVFGISRSTLARWEAAGKITAVYSRSNTTGAGASVFRRANMESLRVETLENHRPESTRQSA